MHYVYYLRSTTHQHKTYVGFTNNLKNRFAVHNAGGSTYTKDFRP